MVNTTISPPFLEGMPVYNVNLHIISSDSESTKDESASRELGIKEKITQISACVLMLTGALFILVSAGLFASSLLPGVGPASAMIGEVMYPLGVLSLMAGLNLFQDDKKAGFKISSRLGPVSISL